MSDAIDEARAAVLHDALLVGELNGMHDLGVSLDNLIAVVERDKDAEIARLNAVIEADKGRRVNTARRYDKRIADLDEALTQAHAERDALAAALRSIEERCDMSVSVEGRTVATIAREALTSMERGQA